jgi:hypothetical protein
MPPAPRSRSTANALVAAGLVAFGLAAAAYPVYAARSIQVGGTPLLCHTLTPRPAKLLLRKPLHLHPHTADGGVS